MLKSYNNTLSDAESEYFCSHSSQTLHLPCLIFPFTSLTCSLNYFTFL